MELRTSQISYECREGSFQYCVHPQRCLAPSPSTSQSSSAPRWLKKKTRKTRGGNKTKKHTWAIKGQGPEGCGVFGTLGQCTSIEIDVVGGAQDKDALARLRKEN